MQWRHCRCTKRCITHSVDIISHLITHSGGNYYDVLTLCTYNFQNRSTAVTAPPPIERALKTDVVTILSVYQTMYNSFCWYNIIECGWRVMWGGRYFLYHLIFFQVVDRLWTMGQKRYLLESGRSGRVVFFSIGTTSDLSQYFKATRVDFNSSPCSIQVHPN